MGRRQAPFHPLDRPPPIGALALALVGVTTVQVAINLADWRLAQPLNLPLPGLIKVPLAAETLAALRPEAADLRLIDPAQSEIGWFLERPLHLQPDAPIRPAKSFNVTVRPQATDVLVETGITDPLVGLALETGNGSFLKAIPIVSAGAQVLELDPEILAHGQSGLADLRLICDGRQRPFVREPNPAWRTFTVEPTSQDPPKQTAISRWKLKLPYAALPIGALAAESGATLFDRSVTMYETIDDGRGDKVNRALGDDRWRRAPGEPKRSLKLPLAVRPITDTFWIEIRN